MARKRPQTVLPDTAPKPFVFVLMPFDKKFDDVYELGIKAACKEAGTYCERVDEQIYQETILQRVYNQISKADIIVADMTGRNPNVFYEVGYAHALAKTVILLTQSADDIPFDLKNYPHIVYEGVITKLKDELRKRVRWCVEHARESLRKVDAQVDVYLNAQLVTDGAEIGCPRRLFPNEFEWRCEFQLHNRSDLPLDAGALNVSLETDKFDPSHSPRRTVELPTQQREYVFSLEERMFPGGWCQFELLAMAIRSDVLTCPAVVRLYTDLGSKEWRVTLEPRTRT